MNLKQLLFVGLLFFTTTSYGQVTIGANLTPTRAALLDLKTRQTPGIVSLTSDENVTSAEGDGGLLLPRVKLVNSGTLEPFIPSDDDEFRLNANSLQEKLAGLMVYNLNNTNGFIDGIYVWNGASWMPYTVSADNGLSKTGNTIGLGGALMEDTTLITINDKALVFDVTTAADDSINGFRIKGLEPQFNSDIVLVNLKTGKLGRSTGAAAPARIAFMQSATETYLADPKHIRSIGFVVPWAVDDMITNVDLVEDLPVEDAFVMKRSAIVEISAYACYKGVITGVTNMAGQDIVVNAAIQICKNSSNEWMDYSSVRGVYRDNVAHYMNTLSIPPVLLKLDAGDKIRMRLSQPPNELGSGYLGIDHPRPAIVKPHGTKFSKGMKIVCL